MNIERLQIHTSAAIPLIAAFPYAVVPDASEPFEGRYDPISQLTIFAGRDFSTCKSEGSAGTIFKPKSDTKKDD